MMAVGRTVGARREAAKGKIRPAPGRYTACKVAEAACCAAWVRPKGLNAALLSLPACLPAWLSCALHT